MAINDVTFTEFEDVDVPTSDTTVYTSPALTTSLILSLNLANKTAGVVAVSVKIIRTGGSPTTTIVKDAPIPVGSALELIDNKPLILAAGDVIQCACTTGGASAVDATGSVMQVT